MIVGNATLHLGDALTVLEGLESESVHTCITSPPYWGMRDYGQEGQIGLEPTLDDYIDRLLVVLMEVHRVLRDDGTLWLNMGDGYVTRPNGGVGRASTINGKSTQQAYRAACAYRGRKSPAATHLKHKDLMGQPWRVAFALQEAGAADLHAVRTLEQVMAELEAAYEDEPLPDRVAATLERLRAEWVEAKGDSWYLRQDIIWHKPNPMPESVLDRCTKSHEYIFLLAKSRRYYYDQDAIKEPVSPDTHPRYGRARSPSDYPGNQTIASSFEHMPYFRSSLGVNPKAAKAPTGWDTGPGGHRELRGRYTPKQNASFSAAISGNGTKRSGNKERKVRPGPKPSNQAGSNLAGSVPWEGDTRNKRSVWSVVTQAYPEAHYATFPEDLIRPCVLAGSPEGGVVLDPFSGSGTTGAVALEHGRRYIGIELSPEYMEFTRQRCEDAQRQQRLFS